MLAALILPASANSSRRAGDAAVSWANWQCGGAEEGHANAHTRCDGAHTRPLQKQQHGRPQQWSGNVYDIQSASGIERDHGELWRDAEPQRQLGFGDSGRAIGPVTRASRPSQFWRVTSSHERRDVSRGDRIAMDGKIQQ